jgi:2-dehydropantoate 2-reductase
MRSVVSSAATSSLKRDMEAGRQSELETFSGYVVREASKKGVEVPVSIRYYESMRKK